MKNYMKFSALVTTTLLTVALAGPANATGPEPQEPTVETASMPVLAPIKASPTASVAFEKPTVKSVAYVAPAPAPVAVAAAPVAQVPVAVKATPTAQPKAAAPVKAAAPAAVPAPTVSVAPSSGRGAALLASAYSQIGITQDCTAMVERALGSIGIVTGDIAPGAFFRFGTVVGTPAPGDILISAGHVGIYAGNGQMISGGFNGSQTVLHPVSYVGAYSAVRVA
jgi:cell wall-associated NlpC family hydrolase